MMYKKLYYVTVLTFLFNINGSAIGAVSCLSDVSAENILELQFQRKCMPVREIPEFNEVMKALCSATVVSSSKRFSSVDSALNALEKLAKAPGLTADSEYVASIKTLLMPFADFTRCLNRYRPVVVPHGEEIPPEDPLIVNRERAFNIIAAALFDFKDQSAVETILKVFAAGQTPQSLAMGVDGKILSFNGAVVDESVLPEKAFYPHVRRATAEFMGSILRIWESLFMCELRVNKRIAVINAKTPAVQTTSVALANSSKEDSDDDYDFGSDDDGKAKRRFEPES